MALPPTPQEQRLPFALFRETRASSSFTVASTPHEIVRAVEEWAAAAGWKRLAPTLLFGGEGLWPVPVKLEVALDQEEGLTTAVFTAYFESSWDMEAWNMGGGGELIVPTLARIAEAFADGVVSPLRSRGAVVVDGYPASTQSLETAERTVRWTKRLLWPFAAVGVGLFLIVLGVRGLSPYPAVIAGVILWLAATLVTYGYLRWRAIGVGSVWLFVVSMGLWIGVAIAAGLALSS